MEVESRNEVCRACFSTNAPLFIDLNTAMANLTEEISYLECFLKCTQLNDSPHLPPTLCYDCALELEAAYSFIKKCQETDTAFRLKEEELKPNKFEWIEVESNDDLSQEKPKMNNDLSQEKPKHAKSKERKRFARKDKKDTTLSLKSSEEILAEELADLEELKSAEVPMEEEETTTCQFCQKAYLKKALAKHIWSVHGDQRLLCDACPRTFKNWKTLEGHRQTHKTNRPRNFSCEICERKFLTKGILRAHMKTHDKNRKPKFACDQCDKAFFYSGALTIHKKIHTGDTVQCQECQKTFLRPVDLKVHMRMHSGDKPYQCDRCEKSFTTVCHLNKHILRHEGYGYKCNICDKEYKEINSLIGHRKTHLGEEPFKCAICDKSCIKKYQMRLHIQKNHDIHIPDEIEDHIIKISFRTYRTRIPMHKDGKYVYPI